ncbi:Protein LAZ1 [Zea mays]|uniref:Protein LAZ1 n=1 Tax=Zea mays TaxID=4577 RepID=A0A1D6LMQ6_MAIZE|nr:Protein LAZ1 [Zea mays]
MVLFQPQLILGRQSSFFLVRRLIGLSVCGVLLSLWSVFVDPSCIGLLRLRSDSLGRETKVSSGTTEF